MDAIRKVLAKDPIETFSAIKLSVQMYAEVDPSFTQKYYNQLKGSWYVLNHDDRGHLLTCTKSSVNPLLTNGWIEVKHFNEFPENVEVVFGYYGNNMFVVEMFKEVTAHSELPKWHSRSTIPHETAYCDTTLDEHDFLSPMKTINDDFSQILKQYRYQGLIFCGDSGNEENFEVYFLNDQKLTTQFGTKWDHFCKANRFKIGQTIRFKLDLSDTVKCHVYQVASTSTSNASA